MNWRKLLGTTRDFFRINGPGGAGLKYIDAATLEMRNSADSAQGRLRGLDPLVAQDYVTLAYHDANAPAGTITAVRFPVPSTDANVDSTAILPSGCIIHKLEVHFKTTAWSGGTPAIQIQSLDGTVVLATAGEIDPTALGGWIFEDDVAWSVSGTPADRAIRAVVSGTPTAGVDAIVVVHYSVPLA